MSTGLARAETHVVVVLVSVSNVDVVAVSVVTPVYDTDVGAIVSVETPASDVLYAVNVFVNDAVPINF